jgi:hypothetical protein
MLLCAHNAFPGTLIANLGEVNADGTTWIVYFPDAWLESSALLLTLLEFICDMIHESFGQTAGVFVDVPVLITDEGKELQL